MSTWSDWRYALLAAVAVSLCLLWCRLSFTVRALIRAIKRENGQLWTELGQPDPNSFFVIQLDVLMIFDYQRPNLTLWLLNVPADRLPMPTIGPLVARARGQLATMSVLTTGFLAAAVLAAAA